MAIKNGTIRIDEQTQIAGPTHAELRRPFSKPISEQARDVDAGAVDRNHDLAVRVGRPDQRGVAEATPDSTVSAGPRVVQTDVSTIMKEIAAAQPEEK